MAKGFTDEDDALLAELGIETDARPPSARSPREERIIAGFEEIQRFADENGRPPSHGEQGDIFERLYAVRLERIRDQVECRDLCLPFDRQLLSMRVTRCLTRRLSTGSTRTTSRVTLQVLAV